jgi:CheY-like chemotaxis protein
MDRQFSILIVDDEPGLLDILAKTLEKRKHHVIKASTGAEGLEKLSHEPIDLVITDVRMAGLGGLQLLKEIRNRFKGPLPAVFLMSGHAGVSLERMLALGAHAAFDKPFVPFRLLNKIQKALAPAYERWKAPPEFHEDFSFKIEIEDYNKIASEGKIGFGWGGFFLHMSDALPEVGQKVKFTISIKKPKPVQLKGGGEVIWRRSNNHDKEGDVQQQGLAGIGVEISFFDDDSLSPAIFWLESVQPHCYIPDARI